MPAVSIKGVSKNFRTFPNSRARLKEALSFGRKKYGRDFWALKDINLDVEKGTTLGIIGRNGAGKSTLLSIVSGILQPTEGTVEVNGRLVALFALGAGFNSEFTGRENIMLNGLILGIERQEILERFDDIVEFADLGDFIDQPIKTYSSGMRSKLGFAVAVNVEPDVLILDETLAVGDAVYKETALQRMYELRDSGTTILFVSHGMKTVEDFCTEAALIHEGRLMTTGETSEVISEYQALVSSLQSQRKKRRKGGDGQVPDDVAIPSEEELGLDEDAANRVARLRSGTGEARIRSVELLDERLHPVERKVAPDSTVTVRVHLEYLEDVKESELIVTVRNKAGLEVLSASTAEDGTPLKEMNKGDEVLVDFTFNVPLQHGLYNVSADARVGSEDLYLDRANMPNNFRITRPSDRDPYRGVVHLPTEIKVHSPEGEKQGRSA
jgi:ABC-type polysaccharide/polyol phosphate transport system ATPase subunit